MATHKVLTDMIDNMISDIDRQQNNLGQSEWYDQTKIIVRKNLKNLTDSFNGDNTAVINALEIICKRDRRTPVATDMDYIKEELLEELKVGYVVEIDSVEDKRAGRNTTDTYRSYSFVKDE